MNIGREHLSGGKGFASWRDTQVRLVGEAAAVLRAVFMVDWYNAVEESLFDRASYPAVAADLAEGNVPVQILTSGPDSQWSAIRQLYFAMITSAQRHVYMQSPYFILDSTLAEALAAAALSGIKVHVMLTERASGDPVPGWASNTYIQDVVAAGVRIRAGRTEQSIVTHRMSLSLRRCKPVSKFLVAIFRDVTSAQDGLRSLREPASKTNVHLQGAALVTKDRSGKLSMHVVADDGRSVVATSALIAGLSGLVIGPLAAAILATGGAILGASAALIHRDAGMEFAEQVAQDLPHDQVALVAEVTTEDVDALVASLERVGGAVTRKETVSRGEV